MRKLDFRTMCVALLIFGLGYAVCLAMPVIKVDADGPTVIDWLVVMDSISGPTSIVVGGDITLGGSIACNGNVNIAGDYGIEGIPVIDSSFRLKNVIIDSNVTGGSGLDVGKLGGHPASDFVLKSDLLPYFWIRK